MKSYFKGLLSGIALATIITLSCVVFAESIQVVFNTIRISVNGIDEVQWDENYKLNSGKEVPYSIVYKDTTYLPIRKTAELLGKDVFWNEDSKTATIVSSGTRIKLIQKPDTYGNMWTYSVFRTEEGSFLSVKDENRGFERVYRIATSQMESNSPTDVVSVEYTDEAILFVKITGMEQRFSTVGVNSEIWKIKFDSDINNQDGESVKKLPWAVHEVIFDGDYLYYTYTMAAGSGSVDFIEVTNIKTDKSASYSYRWASISNLSHEIDANGNSILSYQLSEMNLPGGIRRHYKVAVIKDDQPAFDEFVDLTPHSIPGE